jgi:uncharacterized protein with NRDE domain
VCTLVLLNEYLTNHTLVVGANRDERFNRLSRPPESKYVNGRTVLRPWDDEKDGTWMGVAQNGWFVGITNQDDGKHDSHLKSRGKVVDQVLGAGNHKYAARVLAHLDPCEYNPFNLVFGRPGAMFLTRVYPGCQIEMEPIPKGITIISNDCCGTRYQRKLNHAYAMASAIEPDDDDAALTVKLMRLLSNHDNAADDPFQALCVHADEYSFGTRSTSLVTVSNQGVVEYWYSEGPPCSEQGLVLAGSLLHLDLEDQ